MEFDKKVKKQLGEMLLEKKLITPEQLEEALSIQKKTKDRLGHTLINLGYIKESVLIKVLEEQFGIPCIKIYKKMINWQVVKQIPEDICVKYRLIPLIIEKNLLTVAVTDPFDMSFVDEIKSTTSYNVEVTLCSEKSVIEAIYQNFGYKDYSEFKKVEEKSIPQKRHKFSIVLILELILKRAINFNAKEIHFQKVNKNFSINYLTKDSFINSEAPSYDFYDDMSKRIKMLSRLKTNSKSFQEGIFKYMKDNVNLLVRVLIFPTHVGENIVLKIIKL